MDNAKKIMEKWGWAKGQGLGKDSKGMTSCLILRKNDGSTNQGRIEQSPAMPVGPSATAPTQSETAPTMAVPGTAGVAAAAVVQVPPMVPSVSMAGNEGAPNAASDALEPLAKKRRSKWGEDDSVPEAVTAGTEERKCSTVNVDMRTSEAATPADAAGLAAVGVLAHAQQAAAATAAATATVPAPAMAEAASTGGPASGGNSGSVTSAAGIPSSGYGSNPSLRADRPRVRHTLYRYWSDWRWSKGTEGLLSFEEVRVPRELVDLAKIVLGDNSRYPARIADDTDCIVDLTAWGTIILRPRGTRADVMQAKRMLYGVLHPHGAELRREVLITPDEEVEAAIRDRSKLYEGLEESSVDFLAHVQEATGRMDGGKLSRVGLGAEVEVKEEEEPNEPKPVGKREIKLATSSDIELVKSHMDYLRIATGVTPVLEEPNLILSGKEKQLRRAEMLMTTLLETGEWVAMTEGFIISEESKLKRRADDGPSEQILVKIAEGQGTQMVEKHLKAMERAAEADQLKLTSRAINGKRTLMVEGTRKAHERVKLMVKELTQKGESPMLTKALGMARAGRSVASVVQDSVGAVAADPTLPSPFAKAAAPCVSSSSTAPAQQTDDKQPGVITAAPRLKKTEASTTDDKVAGLWEDILKEPGSTANTDTKPPEGNVDKTPAQDGQGPPRPASDATADDDQQKLAVTATAATANSSTESSKGIAEKLPTRTSQGVGPGMRNLPAPRLAADIAAGEDLFAGLPAPAAPAPGSTRFNDNRHNPDSPKLEDAAVPFPPSHPALSETDSARTELGPEKPAAFDESMLTKLAVPDALAGGVTE